LIFKNLYFILSSLFLFFVKKMTALSPDIIAVFY